MAWADSVYYRGKRVSRAHHAVLTAYERRYGVPVQLNQGRRTIQEQRYFWNNQPPVAAYPSYRAPHIKFNLAHHALDINQGSGRGQAQHVAQFYRSQGIPVAFNVRGEPWHMDTLDAGKLVAAAKRVAGPPTLREGSKGPSVVRLKKLLYSAGIRNFSGANSSNRYIPYFGKYTKSAVIRYQKSKGLRADGVVGASTWKALGA